MSIIIKKIQIRQEFENAFVNKYYIMQIKGVFYKHFNKKVRL